VVTIGGNEIREVNHVKYLGESFYKHFTWKQYTYMGEGELAKSSYNFYSG